jgi:hypothetical protein
MIAWYGETVSAGTETWDGNYGPCTIPGTASVSWAQSWPAYAYDRWRQEEAAAEALRKYEQSRAWAKAPAVIKPHFSDAYRNNFPNIFSHFCISPRPWSGRNFHK